MYFQENVYVQKENSSQKQGTDSKVMNSNLLTQLLPDKGVIQIGSDETAVDNFVLLIYMGQAMNIDLVSQNVSLNVTSSIKCLGIN